MLLYCKLCVGKKGDVIPDLPPMKYTLMVEATTDDDPPQCASDVVGPTSLTGGSAQCRCKIYAKQKHPGVNKKQPYLCATKSFDIS